MSSAFKTVIILAGALALSACGFNVSIGNPSSDSSPKQSATPETTQENPKTGLDDYYSQTLDWEDCENDLRCAWLTVPLDYENLSGETISIRVSKHVPKEGKAAGTVLVNPGGPGGTGVDFTATVADSISPTLAESMNIVGFDPRGVGQSTPVTCLDGAELTELLQTDGTPDTQAEVDDLLAKTTSFPKACLEQSGELARHVGTDTAIQDIDVLRAVLGMDKLNWLGFSYGTYLGALYAEKYPDRVGRFVLDGVVDPSLDSFEVARGQFEGFEDALTQFAKDCTQQADCPFKGDSAEVLSQLDAFLVGVDQAPLTSEGGRTLTQADATTAIILPMYSTSFWPYLREALNQAKEGNPDGLLYLADVYYERSGADTYDSNMFSAFQAINCWDNPMPGGEEDWRRFEGELVKGSPTPELARSFAWMGAICSNWFGHSNRVPAPIADPTKAPMLIIGTTHDPATPYAWSASLHEQFPGSKLLTFEGDGHTAFGSGEHSGCVDSIVNEYLLTGKLPTADNTVCESN